MTGRDATFYDENGIERLTGTIDNPGGSAATDAVPLPSVGYDHSFQADAYDLQVDPAVGDSTDSHFFAGGMWSILGDTLTKTKNYLGGVIGVYGITGTKATTYPAGAVLAQIADGVTEADGAVVAYIDGDSAQTNCGAMFKVRSNNSTAASGANFGLDLQDASHDGYIPVDAAFYKSAPIRIVSDVTIAVGAADPQSGVTGANVMGPGALYVATTTPKLFINTNTKASPTWTVVGSQS
jgi:hypothetical protein